MSVLDQILNDAIDSSIIPNVSTFRIDIDYDAYRMEKSLLVQRWKSLEHGEKSLFRNVAHFCDCHGLPDHPEDALTSARDLSNIRAEVREKIGRGNTLSFIVVPEKTLSESLLEFVENIENISDIKEVFLIRKLSGAANHPNFSMSATEARRIKNCFAQGRELFLAGQRSSLMVKPLNFFYALTAYSYGIIVLNHPNVHRKDMLSSSHGMSYQPGSLQVKFGGDAARGTFSDLVMSFPAQLVHTDGAEFFIDCTESLIAFSRHRFSVGLGTLLSMIPDMSRYYKLTLNRHSRCYPIIISTVVVGRDLNYEFHIGDGEYRPPLLGIDRSFPGFQYADRQGKTVISIPSAQIGKIRACIYSDVQGNAWYIDNPFYPVILPEIAIHFLISGLFSNIMRYRPDEWGSILANEVLPSISLMTRHYFSSFQRNFLVMILRAASRYMPFSSP